MVVLWVTEGLWTRELLDKNVCFKKSSSGTFGHVLVAVCKRAIMKRERERD